MYPLLFDFGDNLGMAFQIKDDLFDLLGSENDTGKTVEVMSKKYAHSSAYLFVRKPKKKSKSKAQINNEYEKEN